MKILVLGNEFVEEDSLAKEVGELLKDRFEIVSVQDSFQLMSILNGKGEFVLLDVAKGLNRVCFLEADDLKGDSILSAHDFDVVYVLKLVGARVRIIGIPMSGDASEIRDEVLGLIKAT